METEKPAHPAHHLFSVLGIVASCAVIIGAFVVIALYANVFVRSGQMAAVVTATLVELTNEDRTERDLGELQVSPVLVAAAQAKANDMATRGYFAHQSPDGLDSWHWFREEGYSFAYAGENLAVNFSDSANVERAWMDSPTHRANILNDKFTEIGIATAVGEHKGKRAVFVVQMFGAPKQEVVAEVRPLTPTNTPPEEIAVATTEEPNDVAVLGATEIAPEVRDAQIASVSVLDRALASPLTTLQFFYILCGLVLVCALAIVTGIEFKRHHLKHVTVTMVLIILMVVLLVLGNQVIFGAPVLG